MASYVDLTGLSYFLSKMRAANNTWSGTNSFSTATVGNLSVTGSASFTNTVNASISGNAATVGGYAISTSATKNTVVVRDNNNYIYANYINSSIGAEDSITVAYVYCSQDNWIRKQSIGAFATTMAGQAADITTIVDSTPTANSTNLITSGAVYTAITSAITTALNANY